MTIRQRKKNNIRQLNRSFHDLETNSNYVDYKTETYSNNDLKKNDSTDTIMDNPSWIHYTVCRYILSGLPTTPGFTPHFSR